MYIDTLLKLALHETTTVQTPQFEAMVDATVRMPGPIRGGRTIGSTKFPTEASKSQASQAFTATKNSVPTVKTHKIEGIH